MATSLQPYRPEHNPLHHTIAHMVVRSVQDAFNAHVPERVAANFSDEAAWTSVMGKRLTGRDEIEAFGRTVMPKFLDSFARYEVTGILAIRQDVLAVNVLQTPVDAEGNSVDGQRAVSLYIIAREEGGWKIVAGQNTFLADPA